MNQAQMYCPQQPAGPAPVRTPGSVRRTSSIDMFWPDGQASGVSLIGRARDVHTPIHGGEPFVWTEDYVKAHLGADRVIQTIEAKPQRADLAQLVGKRVGGNLRNAIQEFLPEERGQATPLYLLLDDFSGASLVSHWAWLRWWYVDRADRSATDDAELNARRKQLEGVCIGLAPGSSALDSKTAVPRGTPVPELRNPEDLEGWHPFKDAVGPSLRRARRIDIQLKSLILIDSGFQDSATTPNGQRVAVHEYTLRATADPKSLRLLSLHAIPHILPGKECPAAAINLPRLLGTPLPDLREQVMVELRLTAGCTHLNDALRSLTEVPALLRYLPGNRS